MIHIKSKDVSQIFKENKFITTVHYGARLVWEAVKSCFGSGFWIPAKPWLSNEAWRYKTQRR